MLAEALTVANNKARMGKAVLMVRQAAEARLRMRRDEQLATAQRVIARYARARAARKWVGLLRLRRRAEAVWASSAEELELEDIDVFAPVAAAEYYSGQPHYRGHPPPGAALLLSPSGRPLEPPLSPAGGAGSPDGAALVAPMPIGGYAADSAAADVAIALAAPPEGLLAPAQFEYFDESLSVEQLAMLDALADMRIGFVRHDHSVRGTPSFANRMLMPRVG